MVVENSRYETVLSSNREKARILQAPAACSTQVEHRQNFGVVLTVALATVKHMSVKRMFKVDLLYSPLASPFLGSRIAQRVQLFRFL